MPLPPMHGIADGSGSDARQIFKHEKGAGRMGVHECLRDDVVDVPHVTVLSRSYLPQPSPRRRGLSLLKPTPEIPIKTPFVSDGFAGEIRRLAIRVIRHGDVMLTPIDADDVGDVAVSDRKSTRLNSSHQIISY